MSKEKFTPGPWVAEIHRINTPHEQSVGFFVRTITDKPGERRQISGYVKTYNPELFKEIEADAALISAAPEMYEFGETTAEVLRILLERLGPKPAGLDAEIKRLAEERIAEWREIGKKARGEV